MFCFIYSICRLLKILLDFTNDLYMSYRSLFASSYLGLIHILLDQTRHDEMRILGCEALYDFVTNQVHNSCQFYLSYSKQNQFFLRFKI